MTFDKKSCLPQIEILYFGRRYGHILTSILEPFVSLYKIHAAVSAYEIYKEFMHVPSHRYEINSVRGTHYGTLDEDISGS